MDHDIFTPLSSVETQLEIANIFWGTPLSSPRRKANNLTSYFQYYAEQCNAVYHVYGRDFPLKIHRDTVNIAVDILQGCGRPHVKAQIATRYPHLRGGSPKNDNILEGAINLIVRLLTVVDIGHFPRTYTGRVAYQWVDGACAGFLGGTVFPHQKTLSGQGVKLGSLFTARNLNLVTGLDIQLTANLADHLALRESENKVLIFHHASFLKSQESSALLPKELVEETLRTLALLLPRGDKDTSRWYARQEDTVELDWAVLNCEPLSRNIGEYHYWHDRLIMLKEKFDDPPQKMSVRQLWNFDQRGVQWYAFWVAIFFTVFFGLIQSIEGGVQVYKAFHPS